MPRKTSPDLVGYQGYEFLSYPERIATYCPQYENVTLNEFLGVAKELEKQLVQSKTPKLLIDLDSILLLQRHKQLNNILVKKGDLCLALLKNRRVVNALITKVLSVSDFLETIGKVDFNPLLNIEGDYGELALDRGHVTFSYLFCLPYQADKVFPSPNTKLYTLYFWNKISFREVEWIIFNNKQAQLEFEKESDEQSELFSKFMNDVKSCRFYFGIVNPELTIGEVSQAIQHSGSHVGVLKDRIPRLQEAPLREIDEELALSPTASP